MTWRITLTVPDNRLNSTLTAIGKRGIRFMVERTDTEAVDTEPSGGNGSPIISLGPREPAIGTVGAKIIALLEKLEAKHGAHSVTRAQLTDAMKAAKFTESQLSTGVTNALIAKFLRSSHGRYSDE